MSTLEVRSPYMRHVLSTPEQVIRSSCHATTLFQQSLPSFFVTWRAILHALSRYPPSSYCTDKEKPGTMISGSRYEDIKL